MYNVDHLHPLTPRDKSRCTFRTYMLTNICVDMEPNVHTFDASDVVADIFVEPVGI